MNFSEAIESRGAPLRSEYWTQSLGPHFSKPDKRFFLYFLLFFFFLIEGLLGLAIFKGPSILLHYMDFTTVYALHTAICYSACLWLVDATVHRVSKEWGRYQNRTLGKTCLIWLGGFFAGYIMHRTIVPCLMHIYASDVVEHYLSHPEEKPTHLAVLLYSFPYWAAAVFLALRIAIKNCDTLQKGLDAPSDAIPHQARTASIRYNHANRARTENDGDSAYEESLQVYDGLRQVRIAIPLITHISVEDHYCRVFYSNGREPENILIRSSLKNLLEKLPAQDFVRIHRSHVVNLNRVSSVRKNGREAIIVLDEQQFELPVSRYRLSHIRQMTKDVLGSDADCKR
jgi:hypothetical protein